MACEHCPTVFKKSKKDLIKKSEGNCTVCDCTGPNLWCCLQNECDFVGCPESKRDHSSKHFVETEHSVAVNLATFRIWCYACKNELRLPEFFSPAEMKAMKQAKKRIPGSAKPANRENHESSDRLMVPNQLSPNVKFATLASMSDVMYGVDDISSITATRGLTGLRNLGNTCYMNAALQSLSNCPQLTLHFLALGKFQNMEKKSTMAKSYHRLISDMWSRLRLASVSPSTLNQAVKFINPAFRGHQQQDTQEFLRCLMDSLHEDMKLPFPVADLSEHKQEAGDANNLTAHHPMSTPAIQSEQLIEDTVSMAISSSSDESFISCDSNDASMDDLGARSDESQPMLQDVNFPKELDELHSSGHPLFRSNSFPSLATKSAKSDYAVAEVRAEMLRKRTTSSRSTTQIENVDPQTKAKKETRIEHRSIISDIFDGALRSSVQCKTCLSISHTRETFQDLSLPIPGKDDTVRLHGSHPTFMPLSVPPSPPTPGGPCANVEGYNYGFYTAWEWLKSWFWGPSVTLADCLSAFFSSDELKGDNMYSCDKCKNIGTMEFDGFRMLRNGVKYCRLLKLPEVLCVHLKRFRHEYLTSYSTKISSVVLFPLKGLDLSRYVASDCGPQVKTYDLTSVIVHHGGAGGGHYTSYCKNPLNKKWYEFDDQYVTEVPESTVAGAEAYVLFYSKSSNDTSLFRDQVAKSDLASSQPVLMKFYISVQWVVQFLTFAEPGPINNSYYLCRHGNVSPAIVGDIGEKVCCVSEHTWHALLERFGGGPAVTRLQPCETCIHEEKLLEERRSVEHEMFLKLSKQSDDYRAPSYYISMAWFRKWQHYLQGDKNLPGEVDNSSIAVTVEGQTQLKIGSDYGEITEEAWKYLHSQYGGGPCLLRPIPVVSTSPAPDDVMEID